MTPWGTYMWTGSSAGWAVLAYLTGVPHAWFVSIGCALMAAIWWLAQESVDNDY